MGKYGMKGTDYSRAEISVQLSFSTSIVSFLFPSSNIAQMSRQELVRHTA